MPTAPTSKPRFVGEKVRLGDVVSASSERNKGGRCSAVYSVTNSQGFVPSEDYFSKEVYSKDLKTYRVVKRNMIAYNPSRINVGSVALQDKCDEVVVSPLYVVFSVDESRVKPGYAVRFLKSKPGLDQIAFQSIGTVRNNLKFKALCQMRLKLPSLAVQEERLANLASIESQINQSRKAIEEFDQLAKSRFVEMFGDLEHGYKCSSCKLESIAEVGSSKRVFKNELLSEGVPFYRGTEVAELSAGGSIKPNLFISKEYYERLIGSTGKPEIGDLLLPSICPGGQIWCVNTNAPFYFKDGRVLWIRPDRDAVDGVYLRHALSTMFQMSFSNIASGTTFAELKIFLLKELNVPLPELKDQKEFVSFASQVDKSRFVRDHEMNFRCERFTLSWSTIA